MTRQFFIELDESEKILCVLENEKRDNTWIICSHGLFQDKSESWFMLSKIAKEFSAKGISICRYDARGCGDSTNNAINLELKMFTDDLDFMVKYIYHKYNPSRIVILGVGIGCYAVTNIIQHHKIDAVILLNPTFSEIFNFECAFTEEVKHSAENAGHVDISRSTVSKFWLDKLYTSGIEYENFLGQRVSVKLLRDLSAVNFTSAIEKNKIQKSLYILSSEKNECVETCHRLMADNPGIEICVINSDPLFSHPKSQEDIISYIKTWIENIFAEA